MNPTKEQAEACSVATTMGPGELVLINAYAGAGKTTTLKLIANAVAPTGRNSLYVCYNADMARDAKQSLPANVECRTSHSLAYREMMRQHPSWQSRLGNLRGRDLQTQLGIRDPLVAQAIVDTFQFFLCYPAEAGSKPAEAFTSDLVATAGWGYLDGEDVAAVRRGCAAVFRAIFENDGPAIAVPHDAYLWAYLTAQPVMSQDVILLDEGQDLNPLMLFFIRTQLAAGKRIVLVGDRHQSIYGFRKATNALEEMAAQAAYKLTLTESFRFPQHIADAASKVLSTYKGDNVKLVGRGAGRTAPRPSRCFIARTNAAIVAQAVELLAGGHKLHFAATREDREGRFSPVQPYKFGEIEDVYHLWAGRSSGALRTPWLRQFVSYDELREYADPADSGDDSAKKGGDAELRAMVKLVESHKHDTPALLRSIDRASVAPERATWSLSSAHRAKGKEWDNTVLGDDFLPLDNPEKVKELRDKMTKREFAEAVNLLYVAVTRSRAHTAFPASSTAFFSGN